MSLSTNWTHGLSPFTLVLESFGQVEVQHNFEGLVYQLDKQTLSTHSHLRVLDRLKVQHNFEEIVYQLDKQTLPTHT